MAGQDVEPGEDEGTWRIAQRVAPDRVISTVDPEARHMHKRRSEYRDGYKAHLAVEPETGLITAAALTPASAADGPNGVALLAGEERGLEVLADSAYGSSQTRADLRAGGHVQTIKPIPLRPSVPGGFTKDDFTIDTVAGTVTCPAGQVVTITRRNAAVFGVRCRMPVGVAVHHGQGRPHHQPASARGGVDRSSAASRRSELHRRLPALAPHGRTVDRLVGGRQPSTGPYRGVERNQFWLSLRVAAISLRRLVNLGLDHDGTWVLAL